MVWLRNSDIDSNSDIHNLNQFLAFFLSGRLRQVLLYDNIVMVWLQNSDIDSYSDTHN